MDALQVTQRPQLGYVESGRFTASIYFESYENWHYMARRAFRHGMLRDGKYAIRQAKRAFRQYRYFRERIVS